MKKTILLIVLMVLICAIGVNAIQIALDCNGKSTSPGVDASAVCSGDTISISYYISNVQASDNLDQFAVRLDYDGTRAFYSSTALNTPSLIGYDEFMESGEGTAVAGGMAVDSNTVDTGVGIQGDCASGGTCPTGDGNTLKITFVCINGETYYCSGADPDFVIVDTRDTATTKTWWAQPDGVKTLFEAAAGCVDIDGDGYGSPGDASCPNGAEEDCDDTNENINPGATELCNGINDDCNGATADGADEEWLDDPCDGADSDLCNEGLYECSGGSKTCTDNTGDNIELCNGLDDDCDGQTDEDFPDLGDACSVGVGECLSNGLKVCTQDGSGTECDAVAGEPTAEVCDELDNDCDGTIDNGGDALCDDGVYCNGPETCAGAGGCQPGTDIDCSGNNLAEISTCDNDPDNYPFTWDYAAAFTSSCDEGDDKCTTGTQTLTHQCRDDDVDDGLNGDICGAECDQDTDCECAADACIDADQDGYPDDYANYPQYGACIQDCSCSVGTGLGEHCAPTITYNDGVNCPTCTDDADCDDTLYCNGAETCVNGFCQAGTPPNVNDGVGCTDDSCDEDDDVIVNTPNDANCDNDLWCDGFETCDARTDCQPGTAPDCDDPVGCTDDSCNEVTDSCDNIANDANCDDGLYCNGAETCHAVNDCQLGTDVDCSDNNIGGIAICTNNPDANPFTWDYRDAFASSCDEVNDKCTTGDNTISHTCDIIECGADCEKDNDCDDNTCSETYDDYCADKRLVEYDNDKIKDSTTVEDSCGNTCENDCSCTDCAVDCPAPATSIYCVKDVCDAECSVDADCEDGDDYTIDSCLNNCECQHQRVDCIRDEDCNDGNICTDDACNLNTYTCEYNNNNDPCNDDLYCTVNDVCSGGDCSGTARDCSNDDISGIAACTNDPDANPFTWDYRDAFNSVCNEEHDKCTGGDPTITSTCDMEQCDAECEQDNDCVCEEDSCIDSDGDGLIDDYVDYTDYGICEDCSCTGCKSIIIGDDERCLTVMKIPIEQYVSIFSLPLVPEEPVTFNDIQSGCTFTSGYEDVGITYWKAGKDGYEYIDADTVLYPGQGYFTTQENECEFKMEGYKFTAELLGYLGSGDIYLGTGEYKGWNLIGAPSETVEDFDLVEGTCSVVSGPWGFDAADYEYTRTQTLEPGKGYFIKATDDCNLG